MEAIAQRAPGKRQSVLLRLPALLLRAALLCAVLAAFPARAALRFDMFVGYDNVLPQGSWFPITFEVENTGPAFTAKLEVSPGSEVDPGQARTMMIELPTGTTKRFMVPVHSAASSWNSVWAARLLDEKGRKRAEQQSIRLRLQEPGVPLAGAVTRAAVSLPELKFSSGRADLQPRVARLLADILPDNPIALEGLDTIYLSSERLERLAVGQASALLAWLHGGGHLVVGIEQLNHLDGPGEWLKRVLPVEVTGLGTLADHSTLHEWLRSRGRYDGRDYSFTGTTRAGRSVSANTARNPYSDLSKDDSFEQTPLQTASLKLRDGRVLIGTDAEPLAVIARRGRGQITALAFAPELEPFKSWKHAPWFWAKMIDYPPDILADPNANRNRYAGRSIDGVIGAMVDSDQVRKLPVGWLLLLLVAYLAVIGPLDQYWLKKINRQMLTWITFPCYVAFFSALIYFIGYKLRAGESEWNELHVIDIIPHGAAAQTADLRGWTYGSIYSPVNARYAVASEQPFATLRGESGVSRRGVDQESSRARVEQRGNTFVAALDVPVWTSQLFISDWWGQQSAPLRVTLTADEVTVENRLETKLVNALLAINDEVIELGEVPPRKAQTFSRARTTKKYLSTYVSQHGAHFHNALNSRGQAFGGNQYARIADKTNGVIAASFISRLNNSGGDQWNQWNNQGFAAPPGFELGPLLHRGDAVLLAYAPDYSPVKPLNKFSARRNHRNTLFRVAVEMKN